ncbi:MAG: SAM-dependent chlorinase/fluorinase [Anaerolineales bacterium]|nr:SAM-dependent chlorinase/fluorinase [Anaerolineales bacterium]
MKVLSLTTDFGDQDGYVGVMKGVISGILSDVQMIDITHKVRPQDVFGGALVLAANVFYFPEGTVHLAVVDPGVGTARRPIAACIGGHIFVAPDNGVLSLVMEQAEENGWDISIVHVDNPDYWLPAQSNVFHGRDIFAPVAAHLAAGVPLENVGTPLTDPVRFKLPKAEKLENGARGEVIAIDYFGSLATNIPLSMFGDLGGLSKWKVEIGGKVIDGLVKTFGDREPGSLIALFGSTDYLDIAIVNGSAESVLGVGVGEKVRITQASGA